MESKVSTARAPVHPLAKLPTGIDGFDQLSHGGFPLYRTTLLIGGPGAGKTVFALQCLVNAARRHRAPGIFVAFKAGDFDLAGMLAMLAAKKQEIGAQWIVFDGIDVLLTLLYLVRSGERNRALTIVKSRGTSHSNQVRELVLTNSGASSSDVYTAGGEVLMGTLRWEREAEESANRVRHSAEFDHKRRELQFAEASTSAQIKALQLDLERQRAELALYSGERDLRVASSRLRESELRRRRGADPQAVARKSGNGAAR